MKKFIIKLSVYFFLYLIIAESISRLLYLSPDIPVRGVDNVGIQKYLPNQSGYWKGGTHKWKINEDGWPGPTHRKNGRQIAIIGDSFIENFMNPEKCRQTYLLEKKTEIFNFIEFGRSGISFIESLEINKKEKNKNPNIELSLIYLGNNDLKESLSTISRKPDIIQVDLNNNKILPSRLKSPLAKKILYNFKFAFYLHNRFPIANYFPKDNQLSKKIISRDNYSKEYESLIEYASDKYDMSSIIFVLRPETNNDIIKVFQSNNLNHLKLKADDIPSWSFVDDHHWTCYGHRQASLQIAQYLNKTIFQPLALTSQQSK